MAGPNPPPPLELNGRWNVRKKRFPKNIFFLDDPALYPPPLPPLHGPAIERRTFFLRLPLWKRKTFHPSTPSKLSFRYFLTKRQRGKRLQISLVCRHELSLRLTNLAIPNSYIPDPSFIDPLTRQRKQLLWTLQILCRVFDLLQRAWNWREGKTTFYALYLKGQSILLRIRFKGTVHSFTNYL